MQKTSRRRFIKMAGCFSLGTLILPSLSLPAKNKSPIKKYIWNGLALGADMSFTIIHEDKNKAHKIIHRALDEIKRLESYFSIYKEDSLISNLNKKGIIENAPEEFIELISKSIEFGDITDGYFDITVQSAWKKDYPDKDLINYKNIIVDNNHVKFSKEGIKITLNGIAQGYITDKIKNIMIEEGIKNSLIELGEKYALGNSKPNSKGWKIGLAGSQKVINLNDKAISTSSNLTNNYLGSEAHIINPKNPTKSKFNHSVSVISETATEADALSTAIIALDKKDEVDSLKKLKKFEHFYS